MPDVTTSLLRGLFLLDMLILAAVFAWYDWMPPPPPPPGIYVEDSVEPRSAP